MESGLNGVAHIILTAGDFQRSTAFWRDLMAYLDLKIMLDTEAMLYAVGGRTAIGIRRGANLAKGFDQSAPGLHHVCFRMRGRAEIDALHDFLAPRSDILMVHGPQEEPWAPGYYSLLFEDPDGIRIEFNHVPGPGLPAEGQTIGGAAIFD